MKYLLTIPAAALLAACAQAPEPICDYDVPYTGKYSTAAPVCSPRPQPRPEFVFPLGFFDNEDSPEDRPDPEQPDDDRPDDDRPDDDTPDGDHPDDDRPDDDDDDDDQDGPQNPGNDKPVGNAPYDGETGDVPSGKG